LLHLVFMAQRKPADALDSIETWLGQLDSKNEADRELIAWAKTSQAVCYLGQKKYELAEQTANEALAITEIAASNRHRCNNVLGGCLAQQMKFDEAEEKVVEACDEQESMIDDLPAELRWQLPHAAQRVIDVYQLSGKADEVKKWKEKLTAIEERVSELNASGISESEARTINATVWDKVIKPTSDEVRPLTVKELEKMRQVCLQYPSGMYLNTLGVAEYRMGNYTQAITAARQSMEKLPAEMDLPGPHPGDLAILAMSYHRLGEAEKADGYQRQLVKAMQQDAFKDDAEARSFQAEATSMFGVEDE